MGSPEDDGAPLPDTTNQLQQTDDLLTPTLLSPPRSKTPPTVTGKRSHRDVQSARSGSAPINANVLNKALQQMEDAGRRREVTPQGSPSRKRQKIFAGDGRFIPNRSGQDMPASYSLLDDEGSPATPAKSHKKAPSTELHFQKRDANRTYSSLLRSEMFESEVPQRIPQSLEGSGARAKTPPTTSSLLAGPSLTPSTPHKNLFSYGPNAPNSLTPRSTSRSERGPNVNARSELYSLSPMKHSSQNVLLSPRKQPRAVSKVPYKVLDAPELADDFYLNLVDWGPGDILAVGLGDCVYLWSRETGQVDQLCKLDGDSVTSVSWIQRGTHLAIGTNKGHLQIYDTAVSRKLRTMTGHTARLSSLAWNAHILSTGSRDRSILHRDVRTPQMSLRRLTGHKQEVCGLKWNPDTEQLASGGNDNKVFVWERMEERWLHRWGEQEGGHRAAVKAIAWSPHTRGLLASGGGTADRCIKFWNTVSTAQNSANASLAAPPRDPNGRALDLAPSASPSPSLSATSPSHPPPTPHLIRSHDTGSQVCNLLFSTLTAELISTHGYSQHAINVWKYPSMAPVVSLTGHTYRVLYLSMSPDGGTVVTGAGDETLRFWDVFGRKRGEGVGIGSVGAGGGKGEGTVREWGVIR